jgi:CO/xanthine dehydrogenase FAD-binding subunit
VTPGDRYRARALELFNQADCETNSQTRVKFENLAAAFLRLAEQAERNTRLVIEFELPPDKPAQS